MADDLADLATLNRPTFSLVMTELHQKFIEKNLGADFDEDCSSTSSGFGSISTERTHYSSDRSWSCSLPEFCSATRTISSKPRYTVDLIMGPICEDTIQNALRNLRHVPHPNNFPAESYRSLLPSLVSSPRSLPQTIEDLEATRDIGIIEEAKELIRSVIEYPQSVDFEDSSEKELNYNFHDTPVPCPETIYGWQTESYLNRGQRIHTNCIELDTDMTDRFIVELKQRKKKRGLLSRLKFWKKQCKSSEDVVINKDKKRFGAWRLFSCFESSQVVNKILLKS